MVTTIARTIPNIISNLGCLSAIFLLLVVLRDAGFVESLARPGGNATGFTLFEYGLSGKWLELLKQIAPGVTRVEVLRDPTVRSGIGQFAVIQAVAPSFGVELRPIDVRDPARSSAPSQHLRTGRMAGSS
jgi:ABC-type uncharacterized transport system substrate-binding protein